MRRSMLLAIALGLVTAPALAQGTARHPVLRPLEYDLRIGLRPTEERFDATVKLRLRNDGPQPAREASLLLYRLVTVRGVRDARGSALPYTQRVTAFEDYDKQQVNRLVVPLRPALPPGGTVSLEVEYGGRILGYAETGMAYIRDRIDTAYSMLRMDTYAYPVPGSLSRAANVKLGLPEYTYTARVTVPKPFVVANGGELVEVAEQGPSVTYTYRSVRPSWRMDFAAARFGQVREGRLSVFHLPEDSAGGRRVLQAMSRSLALFTRWFGPLDGDPPLTVIEIPPGWGSQKDETAILQEAFAFRDPRWEPNLYHEVAHFWDGTSAELPAPRWEEGLASFLEDLATDSLAGRTTIDSSATRVAAWLAKRYTADEALRTIAPVDYGKHDMTGYSYWVGQLMFHQLYRRVGHDNFRRIVGGYYRRYRAGGGTSREFARLASEISGADLVPFFEEWLFSTRWGAGLAAVGKP